MTDYHRIAEHQEQNKNQATFTDLARHMKEMIIEEKDNNIQNSQMIGQFKRPIFMVKDMQSTFLTMDKSLLYVGDNSTFQKRITWILAIQWISFSFMVNSMAYFFRSPSFICRVPMTDIFYACSQTIACRMSEDNYKIITQADQISIVQEFHLYCDNSDLIYQTLGLFFLGGFISGYILSFMSERFGRRPVILSVLLLSILSMLTCAFVPASHFKIFATSYFFTGFFLFGYETTVYLYISQISAVRFKTISINMLTMVWAGTPMFLFILRLLGNWRYSFTLFAVIWLFTLPFAYFCFLQSPRFLLGKKCYTQVRQIFQKISITNRRPPYKYKLMQQMQIQNQSFYKFQSQKKEKNLQKLQEEDLTRQYNYTDLFKYSSVKKATFLLMYLWMFRFFMYFALNLALQSVLTSGTTLAIAISTSSFSQVVGTFGILIIKFMFSKKYSTIDIIKISLTVLSILLALLWFTELNDQCKISQKKDNIICWEIMIMIILVNGIKFVNSIFFSALITFSSEVYPTVIRSLGYGFTLTFGRMSTFIVPFYINFMKSNYENRNALCFLAPFGLLGWFLCKLSPKIELGMRDTIPEQDEQIKNKYGRDIELQPLSSELIKRHTSIRR